MLLLFLSNVFAVWPDQNLENGSSGGTHCVLSVGGTTEPFLVPRGISRWSSKGYSVGDSFSWRVGSFRTEGEVVTVCPDNRG